MSGRVLSVRDVSAHDFIKAYAEHLKKSGQVSLPSWVDIVKTAVHNELPPANDDWYYVRVAAVARKVYLRPDVGVGALRRAFGGKDHKDVKKPHVRRAVGGVIRHAFHDLEKLGIVEKTDKGCVGMPGQHAGVDFRSPALATWCRNVVVHPGLPTP